MDRFFGRLCLMGLFENGEPNAIATLGSESALSSNENDLDGLNESFGGVDLASSSILT